MNQSVHYEAVRGYEPADERADGRADEQMDEQANEQTDGQTVRTFRVDSRPTCDVIIPSSVSLLCQKCLGLMENINDEICDQTANPKLFFSFWVGLISNFSDCLFLGFYVLESKP